jgi:predicted O-methyltransferase YrrM
LKDHKNSFGANLPYLLRNLVRYGHPRRLLKAIGREIKVQASPIPVIGLDKLLPFPQPIHGDFSNSTFVAFLVASYGARDVFEFGTYLGETAMAVADKCPDAHVTTLDLPDELANDFPLAKARSGVEVTDEYLFQSKRGRLIQGEAAGRITQLRQDSAKFDPTPYAHAFDFIYIDASHSYSAVKADSEKAFQMLRPGGRILWDDYGYTGVWRYLNELAESRKGLPLYCLPDFGKVILAGAPAKL